jgi:hypothetical protein
MSSLYIKTDDVTQVVMLKSSNLSIRPTSKDSFVLFKPLLLVPSKNVANMFLLYETSTKTGFFEILCTFSIVSVPISQN